MSPATGRETPRDRRKGRRIPPVPSPAPVIATVVDPQGRDVALDAEGWGHIVTEHRELASNQEAILSAVRRPSKQVPDPIAGRERYYRQGIGPSRWIMTVVDFSQTPARIVTAFALRRIRT